MDYDDLIREQLRFKVTVEPDPVYQKKNSNANFRLVLRLMQRKIK